MDQKCWFVLKQRHYPPPTIPDGDSGSMKGPICLGHLIPDLRHLDNVINRQGLREIPADMAIQRTYSHDTSWKETNQLNANLSLGAKVLAVPGVTVNASAGAAFLRSVDNASHFDTLDTYIVQATQAYVEDSLYTEEVSKYIKENPSINRSFYMITGITVARGAKVSKSEKKGVRAAGEMGSGYSGVVDAAVRADVSKESEVSISAQSVSDFVWSVRLAKISRKGIFDRRWHFETFSDGATYGTESEDAPDTIMKCLLQEGIEKDNIVMADGDNEVFVL